MTPISIRTKEAIKTGLAMAISYGIAMHLGWDNPKWAGMAVAVISLSTAGQSLNKGAMRMLGTLVALVASLSFLALFSQDRWLFMIFVSLYVGFCTYMVAGKKRVYFWFVSAFVCLLIATSGGADPQNAFYTGLTRAQETGLGILVYALVSVLLWPQSSAGNLDAVSRKLFTVQLKLYRAYCGLITGERTGEKYKALKLQEIQLLGQFGQILMGAQTDTYTVWELRHQWQRFHRQATALMETLERWRESFAAIREIDLTELLPNLKPVFSQIDHRLEQTEGMLKGKEPIQAPPRSNLKTNSEKFFGLTHFQQAAVAVTRAQINDLDRISQSLFDYVQDIKGIKSPDRAPRHTGRHKFDPVLDPDRLAAAFQVMLTMWISFLVWVYINPPGHDMFVFFATLMALIAAMTHLSVSIMFWPFVYGSAVAGILYIFVMPHLSSYTQLGLMIFGVTFGYYYLFWKPQQALIKMAGIGVFIALTSIQNQQTYSFAAYANSAAMIILACTLAIAIQFILGSPRPEKAFLRLVSRFCRHSEFLLSRVALDRDEQRGLVQRWQMLIYRNDLLEIPAKLAVMGQRIDYKLLSGQTPEQVQTLVNSLQAIAYWIKELVEVRELPHADLLVAAALEDLRAWRLTAQEQLRLWADDPALAASQADAIRDRLRTRMSNLEEKMGNALRGLKEGEVNQGEMENFYQILGAFRGLSEGGIDYTKAAEEIDWQELQEARF
ncbi:hypothetical protein D1AOALGA4SA_12311 [Olavius algarvensis Delta 1 endosymbiont]|nr:hypothetical protein D1AOALGA4SA_12311 [Olavius algarvensis Delta 1 endosymbiont]